MTYETLPYLAHTDTDIHTCTQCDLWFRHNRSVVLGRALRGAYGLGHRGEMGGANYQQRGPVVSLDRVHKHSTADQRGE